MSLKFFQVRLKVKEIEFKTGMVIIIVGAKEHPEEISHFTVSGIFTLIVPFH